MSRESLPGYKNGYRYGKYPEVDKKVDELNGIIASYGGGIFFLDENGQPVKIITSNPMLEIPESMPEEIRMKARAAVLSVLQAMQSAEIAPCCNLIDDPAFDKEAGDKIEYLGFEGDGVDGYTHLLRKKNNDWIAIGGKRPEVPNLHIGNKVRLHKSERNPEVEAEIIGFAHPAYNHYGGLVKLKYGDQVGNFFPERFVLLEDK